MMSSANVYAAILGLTVTFLISSGVALGQEGNAGQSNPGYSGASGAVNPSRIDDATLKQTAKAYVKVQQIVKEADQDLNKTNDNAQQQQIATQAESRKMAAVKAEGLQPQQYNQVIQLARTDKAFEQKFLSYVNEVQNSSS
jgi:ribosome-binding protein aMBF1 (putative translation factor)